MCRYAMYGPYKQHYACFVCRKTFKRHQDCDLPDHIVRQRDDDASVPCPNCNAPMHCMGMDFKAPKKKLTSNSGKKLSCCTVTVLPITRVGAAALVNVRKDFPTSNHFCWNRLIGLDRKNCLPNIWNEPNRSASNSSAMPTRSRNDPRLGSKDFGALGSVKIHTNLTAQLVNSGDCRA